VNVMIAQLCIQWCASLIGDVHPPSCCFTVTDTRIPVENIVKYDMQDTALCGIRAVRHVQSCYIILQFESLFYL